MGRWGGVLIASLQYFINIGSTITNIILTGQLLQSVYTNLCTGKPTKQQQRVCSAFDFMQAQEHKHAICLQSYASDISSDCWPASQQGS